MNSHRKQLRLVRGSLAVLLIALIFSATVVFAQDKGGWGSTNPPGPWNGNKPVTPNPDPIGWKKPTPTPDPGKGPPGGGGGGGGGGWGGGASSNRVEAEPIVLSGGQVGRLLGKPVNQIAAYRWQNGWQQVAVQVDERVVRDLKVVRGEGGHSGNMQPFYADPATFVGADHDPRLDADDEVVFMSTAAGDRAPGNAGAPWGVDAASRVTVRLNDPLQGGYQGIVYLFAHPNPPQVASSWINYNFRPFGALGSGWEDSTISTANYSTHFRDEWVNDRQVLGGVDILDQHKTRFALGYCGRTEETFSAGAVFLANKVGPVRAIRSVMGANSGKYTQRDTFFYSNRQETVTVLRVHEVVSLMDYYDYSAAASGMTYYNNNVRGGVVIDGRPDNVPNGYLSWELLTGRPGSLIHVHRMQTNAVQSQSSIFVDSHSPGFPTCTGDSSAFGMSGPHIFPVSCTDPVRCGGGARFLTYRRSTFFNAQQRSPAVAEQIQRQTSLPLQATVEY